MEKISRRQFTRGALLVTAAVVLFGGGAAFALEQAPLAIKGYDPVAYFSLGRPTRGLPQLEYEWDEHRYLFATARDRELFMADPARYAPQFSNFCAMALTRGELHEADPENWLISDGRLYIFGETYGPDLFRQDLPGNVTKANQNRSLLP